MDRSTLSPPTHATSTKRGKASLRGQFNVSNNRKNNRIVAIDSGLAVHLNYKTARHH